MAAVAPGAGRNRRHAGATSAVLALTAFLTVSMSAIAVADDLSNSLDTSIDATAELMPLTLGGPNGTTSLYVQPRNGDGKNGCNLTAGATLVVSLASSDTGVATVAPASITFGGCGDTPTVTVHPVAQGSATISLTETSNTTTGTFNLSSATFTVTVAPPPNTAPVLSLTGVAPGASYEFGAVPTAVCEVSDAEDGDASFPASLGPVTGPLSAYGLGSQVATCSYTDAGGLPASASATYSIVDTTGPIVTVPSDVTVEATGPSGAVVTFGATATDAVFGSLAATCSPGSGTMFPVGTTSVACTAADGVGNPGAASFDVTVEDTVAPVVSVTTTAVEGAQGWYSIDSSGTAGVVGTVTATDAVGVDRLECTDDGDPIPGVSGSGDTFTLFDGDHHVVCTATDAAGNPGSDSKTFKVDQTAPTMTATLTPPPNSDGWNNSDVTVSYTCEDRTSGIDPRYGCPAADPLTDNARYEIHKATADLAGNVTTPTFVVLIDKEAPVIWGTVSPAANPNGWNNTDVLVAFECFDGLSGLRSCTGETTLTSEGAGQTVTGTASDHADNESTATVGPINIDKTAPVISATRTPANANGWNDGPVDVVFTCEDGGSGVAFVTDPVTISDDGIHSASGACADLAGNTSSVTVEDIRIDTVAPTITGSRTPDPNANGWNNVDVTVSFVCADNADGSGIDVDTVAGAVLTTEGTDRSVTNTGECVDRAGNAADPVTVGHINIDRSAPTSVAFVGGGVVDGGSYHFGFVPSGPTGCTADGAISGLESCEIDGGYGSSVGSHTITATAVDRAGNQSTRTLTFTVLAWTLRGFYQPVDMPTAATPLLYNTVKNGSTVPLKFEIFAGSDELTDTARVLSLTHARTDCLANAITDEITTTATGTTSLRYDATGGQFVYNWQTPRNAGWCYRVTMTTQDGSSLVAYFKLK
jgi:hypothetical protein